MKKIYVKPKITIHSELNSLELLKQDKKKNRIKKRNHDVEVVYVKYKENQK